MLFMILCTDKPGHAAVRADNRDAHLHYLGGFADQVFAAGPTLDDGGAGMTGSLIIMEFEDGAAAEAFSRDDPYARAGLFESVVVRPWRRVLPVPRGDGR